MLSMDRNWMKYAPFAGLSLGANATGGGDAMFTKKKN